MKYMDEYGYGIYPYVPGKKETDGFAFENQPESNEDQMVWMQKSPTDQKQMRPPKDMSQPKDMSRPNMPAEPYPYSYPQNRELALELIAEAVTGEAEDQDFYAQILRAAPSQEDKDILSGIRKDEMKHSELLRKLYYELTGKMLRQPAPYKNGTRMTYCQALKKALLGEVAAVSKYRKILFGMKERRHVNMLTEIMTDEIRHADLYGLLIAMNGCYPKQATDKNIF